MPQRLPARAVRLDFAAAICSNHGGGSGHAPPVSRETLQVDIARRSAVISDDLIIKGDIRNGGKIEVRGLIEGTVSAEHLVVHPGGRVLGTLKVDNADINGLFEGNAAIKQLISIGSSGIVRGDVRYGKLAMVAGGELTAEVRNVPPEVAGDFNLVVRRGRTVTVTIADISAYDPDDKASDLTFAVGRPVNGFIARASAPGTPVDRFTQAELTAGGILFVHDGNGPGDASFEVVVTDRAGASSGAPRAVQVAVVGG